MGDYKTAIIQYGTDINSDAQAYFSGIKLSKYVISRVGIIMA